jgi:hypothetical protein
LPTFSDPVEVPVVLPDGPMTKDLREQIERSIASIIPPDKRGAVLAVADGDGMQLAAATRVGTRWKLGGEVTRKWGGRVAGKVMVVGTW